MKKQGISLVMLVVTIVVMIIITTITIIGISNLLVSADIQDFANEVDTIETSIKEYYVIYKSLPVTSTKYTTNELLNKLEESYKTKLNTEITENKDTSNVFYVVDLDLLEVSTPERGNGIDDLDVYLVASNTLNVYYLKGVEIEDTVYFSNKELIDKKKVEDNVVISETKDVDLKSSINVTKSTNAWTNNLEIKVDYVPNSGETIYYSINDKAEKSLTGDKITLNKDNLTAEEISSLSNTSKLVIYRRSNGIINEAKEVDISNLDLTAPVVNDIQISVASDGGKNILVLNMTDSLSGVKALYFEYITELVSEKTTNYYVTNSEITKKYLLNNGKVSYVNTLNIEKSIVSLKYIVVDNAGNATDVIEYIVPEDLVITR